MRVRSALVAAVVFGAAPILLAAPAYAVSPDIVVSQVFGGGGNAGAPFTNDYIELFNRGTRPVDVSGWSAQYASASGTSWSVTPLTGTIPAGAYFLVRQSSGGSSGSSIPDPNATGTTAMSASAGKVAISASTTPFTGSTPSGTQVRDFVGYGTANSFEGTGPAPGASSTSAIFRVDAGCSDADDNSTDFVSGSPTPRHLSSPGMACHDVVISQVYGGGGNAGAPYAKDYVELFNRSDTDVDVSGWSVQYAAPTGSAWSSTLLAGSIPAGGYFLVEEASGGSVGTSLPASDSVGNINIGSSGGKIALVSNGWGLSGSGPFGTGVRDFLGYGGANAFEGTGPAAPPSNATASHRAAAGCTDTDQNATDFNLNGPVPRNSDSATRTCGAVTSDRTVSDFDGNGTTDIAVFRPSNSTWYVNGGTVVAWGTNGDLPAPDDYDGDGVTEVAVYRPSNGTWYVRGRSPDALAWGTNGDIPVPGDYDGDGTADLAVYRPSTGTWYVRGQSPDAQAWGTNGDIPVPADYDGDGATDMAVFRPSTGTWFVRRRSPDAVAYGTSGDIPVPADYDGDGATDLAVFRPSNGTWYVRGQSPYAVAYGTNGDIPVPGDYDADGTTDLAVFRLSSATWFVRNGAATNWGTTGDRPTPLPEAVRRAFFT
ncbi:MAG TPA: lamin tail domain-containing protein [Acidimicrobiales bacterium]|nr:lamin tail domain-containing protein [Acidimicrobiales bacterium]